MARLESLNCSQCAAPFEKKEVAEVLAHGMKGVLGCQHCGTIFVNNGESLNPQNVEQDSLTGSGIRIGDNSEVDVKGDMIAGDLINGMVAPRSSPPSDGGINIGGGSRVRVKGNMIGGNKWVSGE